MSSFFNNLTTEKLEQTRLRKAKRCQLLGHKVEKVDGLYHCKKCTNFDDKLTQYQQMRDQTG